MAKRRTHLEVLSDLTNETLEGELPDEELSRLLVAPNFTESDSSGPEAVRLLDTSGGGLCRIEGTTNNNKARQGQFGNAWKRATHSISSEPASLWGDRDVPPSPSSSQPSSRAAYAGPYLEGGYTSVSTYSSLWGQKGPETDTHHQWTCGRFAVEGVVSDGVEVVMAKINVLLTLVRAMAVQWCVSREM